MDGQRELLEAIGVVPLPPEQEAPAKAASGAFERGVAAPGAVRRARRLCGACQPFSR